MKSAADRYEGASLVSADAAGEHAIAVVRLDSGGVIVSAAGALRRTTGQFAELLCGRRIHDLLEANDEIGRVEIDEALAEKQARMVLLRLRDPERLGATRAVSALIARNAGLNGKADQRIVVMKVALSADDRSDDSGSLPSMRYDSVAREQLVSRMSHELRTPLNAVLGFVQLMLADTNPAVDAKHGVWLRHMLDAGNYLTELTTGMSEFAHLQSDHVQLRSEPFEMSEAVRKALNMMRPRAFERGITVGLSVDSQLRPALADEVRVKQVLLNLLSNAVKYNRCNGEIRVQVRNVATRTVEVEVTDTGIGLSETQLGLLFEPFNRLGRENSKVPGTGMGLCICQRLACLMRGSLSVRSLEGESTTFRLLLPAST
jgi:signal transduction histidine kinase